MVVRVLIIDGEDVMVDVNDPERDADPLHSQRLEVLRDGEKCRPCRRRLRVRSVSSAVIGDRRRATELVERNRSPSREAAAPTVVPQ